jgi:phage baseplate assembly protein W
MNEYSASREILGVGWHFPVRTDRRRPGDMVAPDRGRGGIALARYEEDIEQAIRIILTTNKGERRMRPTFGCEIQTLVFAPANASTFGLMRFYVEDALAIWEPRISVRNIDVVPVDAGSQVDIIISYEIRATKDERTLVYPFFVIGEEE